MGMVKQLYEDYCEAMHPHDYDAQDALFESICNGTVKLTPEEMQVVVNNRNSLKQLLEAAKTAMHCFTAESEEEWRKSQSYEESPYHFLYKAILEGEKFV